MILAYSAVEIALGVLIFLPILGAGIGAVYLGIALLDERLGRVAAVLAVLILIAAVVALFASGWVADFLDGPIDGGGGESCVPDPRAGSICE